VEESDYLRCQRDCRGGAIIGRTAEIPGGSPRTVIAADPEAFGSAVVGVADVRVGLLGPLEVRVGGASVELRGDRPAVVLALLALSAGRPVGVEALADAVWGENPPNRVRGSLQSLVMRLRQTLNTPTITTSAAGYTLDVDPEHVDLWRFRRLVAEANAARDDDPAKASELLSLALRLWRGEPFEGLRIRTAEGEVALALEEERIGAHQLRLEIDLAAGRGALIVPELRALTARYPLRESLWRQLLVALAQAGAPAEAVNAYHEARRHLADRLGIEPSRELRAVYQRLLTARPVSAEPGVASRTVVPDSDPGHGTRRGEPPRQLRADLGFVAGREAELESLDALLARSRDSALFLATVDGPAGVGKSALAVHWAHRVRDRFPDGQLYLDLGGFCADSSQAPLPPTVAVAMLLASLGVPADRLPETLDDRSALLRSTLADHRVLIVLDDAADADQVRPLLPGRGGHVLVTSRNQLRGLTSRNGAQRVTLARLPQRAAVDLLVAKIGAPRAAAEPEAVAELAVLCAGLPLALCIAAERVSRDPRLRLSSLVEQARDEHTRLDILANNQDPAGDIRAALTASRRTLSPEADRLFRLLGIVPAPPISVPAAAALTGDPDTARVRAAVDQLVAVHLLEPRRPGQYELEELPRLYAAQLANTDLTSAERAEALTRFADWSAAQS
jgi:DNA-binding SARP family transcriptional activator